MAEINVKINGESAALPEGTTVENLVKIRKLEGFFAVEINLEIINKEDYARKINNGDTIEIVSFTGGG